MTGSELWDIRIYGLVLTAVLVVMTLRGIQWVVKTELLLLAMLTVSILWLVLGTFIQEPSPNTTGFVGWDADLFRENLKPGMLFPAPSPVSVSPCVRCSGFFPLFLDTLKSLP